MFTVIEVNEASARLAECAQDIWSLERQLRKTEQVQDHTGSEDIHLFIVSPALHELRRCISWGSAAAGHLFIVRLLTRKAKVSENCATTGCEENVVCLDIAVHDALSMHMSKT
jgi:hypothetical protein